MPVITCPACDTKGSVPDTFPGGRIRCPACQHAFAVPAGGQATAAPASRPAPAAPPAARPSPPPAAPRPAAPSRNLSQRPVAPPPPQPDWLDDEELDEVEEVYEAPRPVRSTRGAAKASSGNSTAIYAAIGAGGVAVVCLLALVFVLLNRGGDEATANNVAMANSIPQGMLTPQPANPANVPPAAAPTPPPPPAATDPMEIVKHLKEATVYVKLKINGKTLSTGTGFVIENQGDTCLIATNKHVAVPDYSELPESLAPEGAVPEIEVVFRSGQGPQVEQALEAKIAGADLSEDLNRDLAFLVAKGVRNPPRPIQVQQRIEPIEGMRYTGGGFPLGDIVNLSSGNQGNPSITITSGTVSALRRDDAGLLSIVQVDGSLQPGNSGGPLVDAKTGRLLGVAVAKSAMADTIGMIVPADQVIRAMEGRVGAVILKQTTAPESFADLEVKAQLMDPKGRLQAVMLNAAPADAVGQVRPNADGTWPPLPNSRAVELTQDPNKPIATGRVQLNLNVQSKNPRKVVIQAGYRDGSGRLVYDRPSVIDLPSRPGVIVDGGRFEKLMKARRKKSLAKLGPLVDPDDDCRLEKDEQDFSIGIDVPGKKVHSLSPEIYVKRGQPLHNSPMTLAEVSGDFAAIVKVAGEFNPGSEKVKGPRNQTLPITFQGAGLIVYEDKDNFLRLERSTGTEGGLSLVHRLLIEVVRDGKQAIQPLYLDLPENELTLILIRRKGRVQMLFSPDDKSLIAFEELAIDFPETVKVGLSATNISQKPLEAKFEDFVILDDSTMINDEFGE